MGDLCNLYRCDLSGSKRGGVFKIARSYRGNPHVAREAETLRRLHEADREARYAPFLPVHVGSIQYSQDDKEPDRLVNVLSYFEGITGPDDLYSLEQVRAAYPNGLDARDMAWIWRRLLTILGFVHQQNLAHTAVTPDHILIEPREHKLILIAFSAAAPFGMLPYLAPMRWRKWYPSAASGTFVASAQNDLLFAANSMSYLIGKNVEPGISRHMQRAGETRDAWKLLDDFDKLIEVLWGPRQFRLLEMPRTV